MGSVTMRIDSSVDGVVCNIFVRMQKQWPIAICFVKHILEVFHRVTVDTYVVLVTRAIVQGILGVVKAQSCAYVMSFPTSGNRVPDNYSNSEQKRSLTRRESPC